MEGGKAAVIEVANRYLQDGLLGHEGVQVPLAVDCVLIENGLKTGGSGEHIAARLTHNEGIRALTGISNVR